MIRRSSLSARAAMAGCTVLAAALSVACSSKSTSPPPATDGGTTTVAWKAAVGAGGTVVQTFDDVSWQSRTVMRVDLLSVACVGNTVGWAAGAGGTIAHTEDGGKTWTAQASQLREDLRAVRFGGTPDGGFLGVVAGDRGALAVSRDGATWAPVAESPAGRASLRGAAVASDVGLLLVVGDGGVVLRSEDRGVTWQPSTIAGAADLRGIAADPGAHLVLAVDTRGSVWASADRGVTFVREAVAPLGAALDGVSMSDDGARALAVGAHGTAITRDAAGAWTALPAVTSADLHAALVTSLVSGADARLYAAGDHGTLLAISPSESAWSQVPTGTTATLYGLEDL